MFILQNILHIVGTEVDTLVDVVALDASDALKALNAVRALPSEPQSWVMEMKVHSISRCALWSTHTKQKANVKAMSLYWVTIISSLPVTPGESEREVAFQLGSVAI